MSKPGFRALENQYFEEARRLAEEDRKRRLLSIRPAKSVQNTSNSARITPGGLHDTSSKSGLSAGLDILRDTRHVFIQRAGTEFVDKFFDLENRFDLLNTTGERIFFAGETIQAHQEKQSGCCQFKLVTPPFDVSVVSCDGGGVLSVTSRGSGGATISDFRNVLGTVSTRREFSWCCGILCGLITTYSVKDKSGSEVFKIGPRPKSSEGDEAMEFNVFTTNMKELIGRISRKWPADEVPPHALWSTAYGISFPVDSSIETKALLLGCLIAISGQHQFKDLGAFKQRDY